MSARIPVAIMAFGVTMLALANPTRAFASDVDTPSLPKLVDEGCETACGPISCYVAARSLDVPVSLNEMIDKCKWKKGSLTTVQQIQDALSSFPAYIKSVPTRLTLDSLARYLKNGDYVAVVPVRKNSQEINHAVCLVGFENGTFKAVDYPELSRWYTSAELADIWDGPVLLVSHSLWHKILANWMSLILPMVVSCGALGYLTGNRRMRLPANGRHPPTSARSAPALCLVVVLQQIGCGIHTPTTASPTAAKSGSTTSSKATTPEASAGEAIFVNHDFGIVNQNEPIEHLFAIKNDRDVSIDYSNHKAGCACLTVRGPCVLPPHSDGSIKIRFDPRGLQGRVQRRMSIHSDDSSVQPVVITMTATVAGVWPSPTAVDLGQLRKNQQSSGTIVIGAAGFPDAKIESVSSQDPAIKVTLEKAGPNEAARISGVTPFCRATIKWSGETIAPGRFSTIVSFATNVPDFPKLDVSVVGYFKGRLDTDPANLYFGNVGPGTNSRRSCKILGDEFNATALQRLSVKVDHQFVSAAFSQHASSESAGAIMNVDLNIPEKGIEGLVKGDLVVSGDNGEFLFAVPYSVLVR